MSGQDRVDRYFDDEASYWRSVYAEDDLQSLVYRQRMGTVEAWLHALPLSTAAQALDVGCGAGLMTVAMAGRGLNVTATDSSPEMIAQCERRVRAAGLDGHVAVARADAHALPFADGSFDLVVAIGLLPWLHDPAGGVRELVRVTRPDGWIIVTADNRRRLNRLIEPRESPVLAPLRVARRRHRERRGRMPGGVPSYRHTPQELDGMLIAEGAVPTRRTTVGFGPFTVLGRRIVPDAAGRRLHHALERISGRRRRLHGTGWHYIVAAHKLGSAGGSAGAQADGG